MSDLAQALKISLTFPRGAYSGAEQGVAEDLPSHARVYEAFVAAAGGGPWAVRDGRVLVACDEHRRALTWLEEHEPMGVIAPRTVLTSRDARRYRWRASPVDPADTDFEPLSALDGPIVFLWPEAPGEVTAALEQIAAEVTHVGRADSVAVARVEMGPDAEDGPRTLRSAPGRGPGHVMRVAAPGRLVALEQAHAQASTPKGYGVGSLGKQAADQKDTETNDEAIVLRRFAPSVPQIPWPYAEVWRLPIHADGSASSALASLEHRVGAAVGIHRALVSAIGSDVPSFVTGRDGSGPLRGAGHLAVHVVEREAGDGFDALLALPHGVVAADRERLRQAVARDLRAGCRSRRERTRWFTVTSRERVSDAASFWPEASGLLRTAVPLVLEATGGPHHGEWTLDDAATCSVGYAMRGVLEGEELPWETGWAFRRRLVDTLRDDHGVVVRTRRVRRSASCFVHRASPGELVVAVDAAVDLGDLAPPVGAGFLALGRARHLGGGLLVPAERVGT